MGRYGEFSYKAPKKGLCDPKKYFPEITNDGVNDLLVICEIVINTHYNYISDPQLKEDMRSSALVKMLEYIKSGVFDPEKGSLKNLLYTLARNEAKNQLYRFNRDFPADDEVMAINESPVLQVSELAITIDDSYFDKLTRCDDVMKEKVKSTLNNMGFNTTSDSYVRYEEAERWATYVIHLKRKKGGL